MRRSRAKRVLRVSLGHLVGGDSNSNVVGCQQQPLLLPRPSTPDADLDGASQPDLTPQEAEQFRTLGFVIKRGLIPAVDLVPFQKLWWQQPPCTEAGIVPEDVGSWLDPGRRWPEANRWGLDSSHNWMGRGEPWPRSEHVGRIPHNVNLGGNVWKWHGLGHDPAFVRCTSAHPRMLHVVEALLGGPVRRPRRNRGVYSVFPVSGGKTRLGPHNDGNPTVG